MKLKLLSVVALAWFVVAASAASLPTLLPLPREVTAGGGETRLPASLSIAVGPNASARLNEIAAVLVDELRDQHQVVAQRVSIIDPATWAVRLRVDDPSSDDESYGLRVDDNGIEISATGPRGLLWGAQTLLQLITPTRDGAVVAHAVIADAPQRAWRALLLDPARSFQDIAFLRRTVRVMSAYKFNVLHLHLIDDDAWRFETKAFPKCNPDGEPFYTQEELKALVAYAARYGIEVIPEMDFPGHSRAQVAAYPELDCEGLVRAKHDAIMCAGKDFTWTFIDQVVAEVAAVFPSRYLHLGGDEPFAIKRWGTCPDCQQRMADKGVSTLPSFYNTFITDLDVVARRHGKQLMVWNDAIHPDVEPLPPSHIIVDAWTDYTNARALSELGYPIINSSYGPLYLTSFGLRAGLPLGAVRQWDPTLFVARHPRLNSTEVELAKLAPNADILGGQVSMWATEQGLVESRLYPRALSAAETLWADGRVTDVADFEARYYPRHARALLRMGVVDEATLPKDAFRADVTGDHEIEVNVGAPAWRSDKSYRNFILSFEMRSDVPADTTGVRVRSDTAGAGRLVDITPPPGMRLSKSLQNLKGWHRFEITARGGVLTLTIDECLAWSVPFPDPQAGTIFLQGGASTFRYRDLSVRPLPDLLP